MADRRKVSACVEVRDDVCTLCWKIEGAGPWVHLARDRGGWTKRTDSGNGGGRSTVGRRRLVDGDGVLRWIHGDHTLAGSLASLVPVPESPFEPFDLEVTLHSSNQDDEWTIVASNGAPGGNRVVFDGVRRWEPYLVARGDKDQGETRSDTVGGGSVQVQVLGARGAEVDKIVALLRTLGSKLGPLPRCRVLVDLVPNDSSHARFGSMEHRDAVRSLPADLPHELAHLWVGAGAIPTEAEVWWVDEAIATLLTAERLPKFEVRDGRVLKARQHSPRAAYGYGARALRDALGDTPERLHELVKELVRAGEYGLGTLRGALTDGGELRRLDRWLEANAEDEPFDPRGDSRNPHRVPGLPHPPPGAALHAAGGAQLFEGPLFVVVDSKVKAIGYRTVDVNDDVVEWWSMLPGFRLGPATAGTWASRDFYVPAGTFVPDDWEDFKTMAHDRITQDHPNAQSFDDFHHVVT